MERIRPHSGGNQCVGLMGDPRGDVAPAPRAPGPLGDRDDGHPRPRVPDRAGVPAGAADEVFAGPAADHVGIPEGRAVGGVGGGADRDGGFCAGGGAGAVCGAPGGEVAGGGAGEHSPVVLHGAGGNVHLVQGHDPLGLDPCLQRGGDEVPRDLSFFRVLRDHLRVGDDRVYHRDSVHHDPPGHPGRRRPAPVPVAGRPPEPDCLPAAAVRVHG
mmetsp:Transcript_94415/g.252598  ORF Transcript_94415/g.252598 Transcript_94415/m.252598 type:complete len:214 (-) Transcript_94415:473-1114(-)